MEKYCPICCCSSSDGTINSIFENIYPVIWLIVAPIFFAISFSNADVSSNAFTKEDCPERIPLINAPITVFGMEALICACFPISAREPFLTTTIISPTCTFSDVATLSFTYTLSASTISPFFTLEDLKTNVPIS